MPVAATMAWFIPERGGVEVVEGYDRYEVRGRTLVGYYYYSTHCI